jgi:hypothetical protein
MMLASSGIASSLLFTTFVHLLSWFSASFAITEAIVVSQLLSAVWLRASRFAAQSWSEYGRDDRLEFWRLASTRVACLLFSVAIGMTLIVLCGVPYLQTTRRIFAQLHADADDDDTSLASLVSSVSLAKPRTRRRQLIVSLQRQLLSSAAIFFALFVVIVGFIVTPLASLIMRVNCWQW